jgi:hypothetical protein
MRRILISLAVVLSILIVAVVSLRAAISRPLIFPAPKMRLEPQLPGGSLETAKGERTAYGYYAPGGKKLIVFFHGNGEAMGSMQDLAAAMLKEGFSVLLAEYPGYGYAAEYGVSEENIYTDCTALVQSVQLKYGHLPTDTVLWGFSLGTGVAVELAARKQGERLILMAPFTSTDEAAEHHFFAAAAWLIVDHFNNKAKAPKISYPTLIIHGERDRVLPFKMGQELAGLFPKGALIAIAGADHNDLFSRLGETDWQDITRFAKVN